HLPPVALDPAQIGEIEAIVPHGVMSHRLTFVNGHLDPRMSTLPPAPDGVWITNLGDVMGEATEMLERHLGTVAPAEENGFVALTTGLFAAGALIRPPRGAALAEPVVLAFVTAPGAEPRMAHPRVLIFAEEDSHATVVEAWIGLAGASYLANAVSEIVVGAGA